MMTAAVRQAVEWMCVNTPVIRIFAAVYAINPVSQRVSVKTGFRLSGRSARLFSRTGRSSTAVVTNY